MGLLQEASSSTHTNPSVVHEKCHRPGNALGRSLPMVFIQAGQLSTLSRHKHKTYTPIRKASVHYQPLCWFKQCRRRELLSPGCREDFLQAQVPPCQLWLFHCKMSLMDISKLASQFRGLRGAALLKEVHPWRQTLNV